MCIGVQLNALFLFPLKCCQFLHELLAPQDIDLWILCISLLATGQASARGKLDIPCLLLLMGGGTLTNCGSSDMGCINDTVDPCYSGHSPACMS